MMQLHQVSLINRARSAAIRGRRRFEYLCCGTFLGNPALLHENEAVGDIPGEPHFVGDDQERGAVA